MTISKSRAGRRSGLPRSPAVAAKSLPKPRKRPTQDRARFTVQAIYDALVRIWLRDGPAAVTTRSVAEEAGFAIGTLYDYFPNKTALLSGYVRHAIELLLARIDAEVILAETENWTSRLRRLVEITCGADEKAPFFDAEMFRLEGGIAEPKHHRRVFDELSAKWAEAVRAWRDLTPQPPAETIETLLLAVWGARRYRLLVDPEGVRFSRWVDELEQICRRALAEAR